MAEYVHWNRKFNALVPIKIKNHPADPDGAIRFDIDMGLLHCDRAELFRKKPDFPPIELTLWEITFDLLAEDIDQLLAHWPTDIAGQQLAQWKAETA